MNWVQKRARCTIQDTFNDLIRQIKKDISSFNGLNNVKRKDRLISMRDHQNSKIISEGKETYFVHEGKSRIVPMENTDNEIIIKISNKKIIAILPGINGTDKIEINPVWNQETLTCDLYNADKSKSYPIEQISQMITGDFLFEDI